MGIGIHSGNVIIVTIGYEERMDSTVLGDTVNLASRLEGLTKYYGSSLIVSDATMKLIGHDSPHLFRELDLISVKGRVEPLQIYEIFDADAPDLRQAKLDYRDDLDHAIRLYRDRHFDEARLRFEACKQACVDDPLSAIYIDRCQQHAAIPPDANWGGVHIFDHK